MEPNMDPMQQWLTHIITAFGSGGLVIIASRYLGFRLSSQSQTDVQWQKMLTLSEERALRLESRITAQDVRMTAQDSTIAALQSTVNRITQEHIDCLNVQTALREEIACLKTDRGPNRNAKLPTV